MGTFLAICNNSFILSVLEFATEAYLLHPVLFWFFQHAMEMSELNADILGDVEAGEMNTDPAQEFLNPDAGETGDLTADTTNDDGMKTWSVLLLVLGGK